MQSYASTDQLTINCQLGKRPHPTTAKSQSSDNTTGRWTESEIETFKKGIKLYGKNWSSIHTLIPNRSVTQIRSHAQKYFQRHRNAEEHTTQNSDKSEEEIKTEIAVAPSSECRANLLLHEIDELYVYFVQHLKNIVYLQCHNRDIQSILFIASEMEKIYMNSRQLSTYLESVDSLVNKKMISMAYELDKMQYWYNTVMKENEEYKKFKYMYSIMKINGVVDLRNFSFLAPTQRQPKEKKRESESINSNGFQRYVKSV